MCRFIKRPSFDTYTQVLTRGDGICTAKGRHSVTMIRPLRIQWPVMANGVKCLWMRWTVRLFGQLLVLVGWTASCRNALQDGLMKLRLNFHWLDFDASETGWRPRLDHGYQWTEALGGGNFKTPQGSLPGAYGSDWLASEAIIRRPQKCGLTV